MSLIINELPLVGVHRLATLLTRFKTHSKNFILATEKTDSLRYRLVYSFVDTANQYNLIAGYNGLNYYSEDDLHEIQDNIMLELCRFIEPVSVYDLMMNFNNMGLGLDVTMSELLDHMMYLTENEAETVVLAQSFTVSYEKFKTLRLSHFSEYTEAIDTTESWIHEWMLKNTELPKYLGV